ncbi:nitrite reductase [Actinocorallia populi]|uniref:nitrite reductase n=1 Tax=Actinocorallia populi TaxID=2079200 RepID=UPI001E2C5C26|nr:nitrite reductase [Actinocorallia populi]
MIRDRADRCPGVLRPWIADDGALIRLRLVGGLVDAAALRGIAQVAGLFGDGNLHLTTRANLQIRGVAHTGGRLADEVVEAIRATGLLPSPAHERARNILVSPLTGLAGGRADLRPAAAELDRLLCADPGLAALPGRFLFCLDDGRGDVADRDLDLGLSALDGSRVRLRVGTGHLGPIVPLADAPAALISLARTFLRVRGAGPSAPWHVDELPETGRELFETATHDPRPDGEPLEEPPVSGSRRQGMPPGSTRADLQEHAFRDPRTRPSAPPPFGMIRQDDGRRAEHLAVPDGLLPAVEAVRLAALGPRLIVTPWRSVIVPDLDPS